MNDATRFAMLDRAWDSVEAWDRVTSPLCPCRVLVSPYLAEWRRYKQDWLAGSPDPLGLEEQEAALVQATALIKQYSRPAPLGDIVREGMARRVDAAAAERMAEGEACEAGDPRCAPLPDDPRLGAAATMANDGSTSTPGDTSNPLGVLGGLFSGVAAQAGQAGADAGKQAGAAAGQAAGQAIAAAVPAVAAAVKQELPGIAKAAADAAKPVAAEAGASAGAAAGKAAADSAKASAGGTGLMLLAGALVLGGGAWLLLGQKKK